MKLLWTFFLGDALAVGDRYRMVVALLVLLGGSALLLLRRKPSLGDPSLDATATVFFATTPLYPAVILVGDLLHGTHTLTISKTSLMLFPILRSGWRIRRWEGGLLLAMYVGIGMYLL